MKLSPLIMLRHYIGATLFDLPRFIRCMFTDWTHYRNREDVIEIEPSGAGVQCHWKYSRPLHLCLVFPLTARWLMRKAIRQWPASIVPKPLHVSPDLICSNVDASALASSIPAVSFIIGHRGLARLPQLLKTLASIAGQSGVAFECIVVEQDTESRIKTSDWPSWVKHVFTPTPSPEYAYCRSWTFNVGANMARAPLLILHDNDMILSRDYAAEVVKVASRGFEVLNLKRFIFYLSSQSNSVLKADTQVNHTSVDVVIENAEAGGSIAISREAYDAIGGFDESFVGWGGEDIEFWERCKTRRIWNAGYLPVIHLWHESQPGKRAKNGLGEATADLTAARLAIPPADRIAELVKRERGCLSCKPVK